MANNLLEFKCSACNFTTTRRGNLNKHKKLCKAWREARELSKWRRRRAIDYSGKYSWALRFQTEKKIEKSEKIVK